MELADVDNGRCARRRWNGTLLCSMPAVVVLTGACVHEHMYDMGYCEHHAREVRDGKRACYQCGTCDRSHSCKITVVGEVSS